MPLQLADRTGRHRSFFFVGSLLMLLLGLAVHLPRSFQGQLWLMVAMTLFPANCGAFPDTAVLTSAKDDGDYGRQRLMASVGWGAFSFLTGLLVERHGLSSAFW